jgi:hypothetical protein
MKDNFDQFDMNSPDVTTDNRGLEFDPNKP